MQRSREVEFCLDRAQTYLIERRNIAPSVEAARQDPEIVGQALVGLDKAVNSLNDFIFQDRRLTGFSSEHLSAASFVRSHKRYTSKLPTASVLTKMASNQRLESCEGAFRAANSLMKNGEEGVWQIGNWTFHQDIQDPAVLADALAVEIFGELLSLQISDLPPSQFVVRALEEMLAVHHQDQRMFSSVKQWYTEEEGFSSFVVGMVNGEVRLPFEAGQRIRSTRNFRVIDGHKPEVPESPNTERWIIEPVTDLGENMLVQASMLHRIDMNLSPRKVLTRVRQTLRADRVAENLRVLLGYLDIPKEGQDSVPSLERMEKCLDLHPESYTFKD